MINSPKSLPRVVAGEAIVKFRKPGPLELRGSSQDIEERILERFDFGRRALEGQSELARVKIPLGLSMKQGLEWLRSQPGVEYAGPNHVFDLDEPVDEKRDSKSPSEDAPGVPNDLDRRLWALENSGQTKGTPGVDIEAREAWKTTVGDRKRGPIVAVIDSGVDITHPDLIDNLWTNAGEIPDDGIDNDGNGVIDDVHGYNAYDDNNILTDAKTHGTHVAGTVGATGNNGFGITGVAQQARIMPIKIFGDVGHTNEATVLRALAYADRMGARITTNSWGGVSTPAIEEAYRTSPALHIASAGNSGKNNDLEPHFPGSYRLPNMIAVAATDHNDHLGSYSCYGRETVHLGAPGEDIYSTLPRDRYRSFSGTSMACPHVGGVASLVLTAYPNLTNAQVKDRLLFGTVPNPELEGKTVSGGRLNARLALEDDRIAPGAVSDLKAVARAGEVQVDWRNGGDDGDQGQARLLRLLRSDTAMTEDNFRNALLVNERPCRVPGSQETFSESFPLSKLERTVHYGVIAFDNVGQRSPLAACKVVIPAARVVFEDKPDVPWSVTGDWARVKDGQQSCWTDSPDGNYGYDQRTNITSKPIAIGAGGQTVLRFQHKGSLQRGDSVRIQVSTDGERWDNLGKLEGKSDWSSTDLKLDKYAGQEIQLRFELRSDGATNGDGVYLKGIEVLQGAESVQPVNSVGIHDNPK